MNIKMNSKEKLANSGLENLYSNDSSLSNERLKEFQNYVDN